MKHLFLLSALVLVPSGVLADCGARSITLSHAGWHADDNDLLYTNADAYNEFAHNIKNFPAEDKFKSTINIKSGSVYMCGHGCDKGTLVLASSGWRLKNENISGDMVYKCEGAIDKEWIAYSLPTCTTTNLKPADIDNYTKHDIYVAGSGFCKMPRDLLENKEKCLRASNSRFSLSFNHNVGDVMAFWDDKTGCVCREFLLNSITGTASWQLSMNYRWDGNACVGNTQKAQTKNVQNAQTENICKLKDGTVLSVGKAKKLSGNDCAKYVDEKNIMEKQNGTSFEVVCRTGSTAVCKAAACRDGYNIDHGTGKCTENNPVQKKTSSVSKNNKKQLTPVQAVSDTAAVTETEHATEQKPEQVATEPATVVAPFVCDKNKLSQVISWRDEYSDVTEIYNLAAGLIEYCDLAEINEVEFSGRYSQLSQIVTSHQQSLQLADTLRKNISESHDKLNHFGFDKSHWKTASGNFNGARLASDSIAGVVLGTVGGVVTSNVVKKNQTKSGFEDLKCIIGGQVVADYGDEFMVGQ